MATIEEHIKKGELPNLDEATYKDIFDSVGLNFTDLHQDITPVEFDRLKFNSKINRALVEQRTGKLNTEVLSGYDKLIQDETDIRDKAQNSTDYSIDPNEVQQMIDDLTAERNKHSANMASFNLGANAIERGMLDSINSRMEKNDDKLAKKYEKVNELNSTLQSSHTTFKKRRTQRRMQRVMKKIMKLRAKQGRLIGQQRQIVGNIVERYKKIKDREMRKYGRLIASDKKYMSKIDSINDRITAASEDIKITDQELNNLGYTAKDKFQRISLNADRIKLQNDLRRLQNEKERIEGMRRLRDRLKMLRGKQGLMGSTMRVQPAGGMII